MNKKIINEFGMILIGILLILITTCVYNITDTNNKNINSEHTISMYGSIDDTEKLYGGGYRITIKPDTGNKQFIMYYFPEQTTDIIYTQNEIYVSFIVKKYEVIDGIECITGTVSTISEVGN